MFGAKQERAMGYIIIGTNGANKEKPSSSNQVDTALEAWEKIVELRESGYTVRATSSDGAEVDLDDLKVRALSTEGP
jgi:hypothetical protein